MKKFSSLFFLKVEDIVLDLCSNLLDLVKKFMRTKSETKRKSIARVYFGFMAVVVISLVGCYGYEDVYLKASRDFLYENVKVVSFRNSTTGEVITLHASDVVCHEPGYSESWQSYHHYKRFHEQVCSQTLIVSENSKSLLDHSVVSDIWWSEQVWQYWFENSRFRLTISGQSQETTPEMNDSLQIGEQMYYDVFILNNLVESAQEPHLDSLYLGMHDGVIKIVDSNNQSWVAQ
jgi:hypothetical protein